MNELELQETWVQQVVCFYLYGPQTVSIQHSVCKDDIILCLNIDVVPVDFISFTLFFNIAYLK